MAEPLKSHFGPEIPRRIAGMISVVFPRFDADAFLAEVLNGYEALDLMPRGRQIAKVLSRHLPDDYAEAAEILIASLGPRLDRTENHAEALSRNAPGGGHVEWCVNLLGSFELVKRIDYK